MRINRFKSLFIFSILLIISLFTCSTSPEIEVTKILCENRENPAGVGKTPRFNWILNSAKPGKMQQGYQILVASSSKNLEENIGDLWDTDFITSTRSAWIEYAGKSLAPGKKYFWKVKIRDNDNFESDWSESAFFITGLFDEPDWEGAQWIAFEKLPDSLKLVPGVHGSGNNLGAVAIKRPVVPYFRREFQLPQKIQQALVYVSGLGHYKIYLNGTKISDRLLAPGWTDYRRACFYNTYDITPALVKGENVIGAIVGNGFFNVNRERYRKLVIAYNMPQLILKMQLEYTDGTREVIISDSSWKSAPSPITFTSIYGGEDYDAQLEQPEWCKTEFDDSNWRPVQLVKGPGGLLTPEMDYPLQVMQVLDYQKVRKENENCFVYDFGQNASGIIRLKVRGPKRSVVKLIPGELLGEDSLVTQRASGEPYLLSYTLKGEGEEEWEPQFTYYGFRYVQVEGAVPINFSNPDSLPLVKNIQFLHIRNSTPEIGRFECSNTLFNQVYDLINWAIKSNLMSVTTDCPHREKLGWLEQTHLMGNSIRYIYEIHNLYAKIVDDMIEAQLENGLVPDIAPEYVPFEGGFRDSPEWGSSAVIVPWYLYQWYGDLQPVKKAYPMMKKYVAHLAGKAENHILSHGLGDWFDLGPKEPGPSQLTPLPLTATAIYYYDIKLLSQMAKLIGESADAVQYTKLAEEVRIAFNTKFFAAATGVYATGSQTAYSMPLYFGMADEQHRSRVFQNLVDSIQANYKALTAGDVGYRYLLRALEEGGANQLVYEMNYRDDVPGYGYQLKQGATALTESWAALKYVSNNHMMLGHLMEWFFSGLAGIRPLVDSSGVEIIEIMPNPVGDIKWVKAKCPSIHGEIICNWEKKGEQFLMNISIPVNSKAVVSVPAKEGIEILVNGNVISNSDEIKSHRRKEGRVIVEINSGRFNFTSFIK